MVLACALLHNFIRMYMNLNPEDNIILTLEDMSIGDTLESNDDVESIDVVESSNEWNDIAQEMFESRMSSRLRMLSWRIDVTGPLQNRMH
ncbi:hypothetical protein OSB04_030335 [Centaurea solstitialis]|uniref:DDE Tnp4 domain-containing protein n=1 Tax=Centaurea solstitialis TaxID=347529 RepID=A0AA38VWL3_9ASTR|nr:hypothetical protein OSB04_030335 [Centaurea solstitialis]